ADVRALRQQAVEATLSEDALAQARRTLDALEASARDDVGRQGIDASRIACRRTLHVKVEGTDTTIEVAAGDREAIVAEFEQRYAQQYGFLMPGKALVIEAAAVEAIGRTESADDRRPAFAPRAGALRPIATQRVYTAGA